MYGVSLTFMAILTISLLFGQASTDAEKQNIARPKMSVKNLNERFDDAQVSGNVLLGYRIGNFARKNGVQRVVIHLPEQGSQELCISLMTNDGRFFAENVYTTSAIPGQSAVVQMSPITNRYTKELAQYHQRQLAVRSFPTVDGSCNASNAVFTPQIGNPTSKNLALELLINSETRSATIEMEEIIAADGQPSRLDVKGKLSCRRLEDVSIVGFDTSCKIPYREGYGGKTVKASVKLNDGFEIETLEYWLHVPLVE